MRFHGAACRWRPGRLNPHADVHMNPWNDAGAPAVFHTSALQPALPPTQRLLLLNQSLHFRGWPGLLVPLGPQVAPLDAVEADLPARGPGS